MTWSFTIDGESRKFTAIDPRPVDKGYSGRIWRVTEEGSSLIYAVKEVAADKIRRDWEFTRDLPEEYFIQYLAHNLDEVDNGQAVSPALLMEYANQGNLAKQNTQNTYVGEVIQWSLDIIEGVMAMQAQQKIHRDLYEKNILIVNGRAKITDCEYGKMGITGTVISRAKNSHWLPPETHRSGEYPPDVDSWSAAICIRQLFYGKRILRDIPGLPGFAQCLRALLFPDRSKRETSLQPLKQYLMSCRNTCSDQTLSNFFIQKQIINNMLILNGRFERNYSHTRNQDITGHITQSISFPSSFISTPSVQLSILQLDMYNPHEGPGSITRYRCWADGISETGFAINIETWGRNKIYGIHVEWMAIGEAAS